MTTQNTVSLRAEDFFLKYAGLPLAGQDAPRLVFVQLTGGRGQK
jgi:hypothetical protein